MQTPPSISRFGLWSAVVCGLYLFFACSTVSADPFVGHLDGKVLDPQGAPVPSARVSLVNAGGTALHTVTTDERGDFSFVDVDPGSYQLVADSPAFVSVVTNAAVGGAQQQNVTLQFQQIASAIQAVTVVASGSVVAGR